MGRLLGGEHASTHQSGVEAPRLLKRSLPRLYYCCCCSCCSCWVVCGCFDHVFNSVCVSTALNAMQQSRGKSTVFAQFAPQTCLCATTGMSTTVDKLQIRQLHKRCLDHHNRDVDDCRRTAIAAPPRDSAVKPRHLSLHSNGDSTTLPKNCTEES